MQTHTFTLLVTITDDGSAAVFNPTILAAAVHGALETGCGFTLSSTDVEALKHHPLITPRLGHNNLSPVAAATVSALPGDCTRLPRSKLDPVLAVRNIHRAMRDGVPL